MARRKKSDVNKSELIRGLLTADPNAPTSHIRNALAEQGISVSNQLISNIRGKEFGGGEANGSGAAPAGNGRKSSKRKAGRPRKVDTSLTLEKVREAKKLVDQFGSVDAVREALKFIEEFKNA